MVQACKGGALFPLQAARCVCQPSHSTGHFICCVRCVCRAYGGDLSAGERKRSSRIDSRRGVRSNVLSCGYQS